MDIPGHVGILRWAHLAHETVSVCGQLKSDLRCSACVNERSQERCNTT
jgi:hypothetical protein